MPDNDGRLTGEERDKVVRWLAKHLGDRPCPACGTKSGYVIDPSAVQLATGPTFPFTSPIITPIVVVLCNNCAHVLLFHGGRMGAQETQTQLGFPNA